MIKAWEKYQFLFTELVKRDFKNQYRGAVLGVAWSVLSPLLTLLVMRLVFTHFFGYSIEHYTTFLFCGTLLFSFFSDSTSQGMGTLRNNTGIYSRVNMPKYIFLLSKNTQILCNFSLTMLVFLIFCLLDGVPITVRFLLLLYPILCMMVFNTGLGLFLAVMLIRFRDVQYLWNVVIRLLMYLSAVFYNVSSYPPLAQRLFLLNPVYCFIHYFRQIVLDGEVPPIWFHLLILAYTLAAVALGCAMYRKYKNTYLNYYE